jgi:hypothetical protein
MYICKKIAQKVGATSVTTRSKQLSNRRKFAQSGHSG